MIALLFAVWCAVTAQAQVVSQPFQVFHRVDLDDASPAHGDDWFRDPRGTPKARWAAVVLCQDPCLSWPAYTWTDDDGLVTFAMQPGVQYRLVLLALHDYALSGRKVRVQSDAAGILTYYAVSSQTFTAQSPFVPIQVEFDAAVPGQEWINAAAVASWVVRRRPEAFPTEADNGAEYRIRWYDNGGTTVYSPYSGTVLLDNNVDPMTGRGGIHRKFIISHEFGHMLIHWANYPGAPEALQDWRMLNLLTAADGLTACPELAGHTFNSKEYISGAISEGFANYVTAMAFNRLDEADCKAPSLWYDVDWDPLNLNNQWTRNPFSCEGAPEDTTGAEWITASVPGNAYLDTYCADGGVWNRGTELDWQRFFWDATSKTPMTFVDLVDAVVLAEPHTWIPDDAAGPSIDRPRVRMRAGFVAVGVDAEDAWDDYADYNGVIH